MKIYSVITIGSFILLWPFYFISKINGLETKLDTNVNLVDYVTFPLITNFCIWGTLLIYRFIKKEF